MFVNDQFNWAYCRKYNSDAAKFLLLESMINIACVGLKIQKIGQ